MLHPAETDKDTVKLSQKNDRLQNLVRDLQEQLEELQNKNEQEGIRKNVTQE
jgi:uncharacterized protein YlxW (UPF0749 family)